MIKLLFAAMFCVLVQAALAETTTVKVMSYNILHGVNLQGENTLVAQGELIRRLDPDVVALQEVDRRVQRSGGVDQVTVLADKAGAAARWFCKHYDYQGGEYGLGFVSKLALNTSGNQCHRIPLINNDGSTETRALLAAEAMLDDGTTITVVSVHMGLNQSTRLAQAAEIVRLFGLHERVILCGDMNAESGTPEMQILERAFKNVGSPELTFPTGKPTKKIDFIMVRPMDAKVSAFRVLDEVTLSDHYPIWAEIEMPLAGKK